MIVLLLFAMLYNFHDGFKIRTFSPFIVFFIFLYSFVISFGFEVKEALRIQLFLSTIILFLIYFIDVFRVDMDKVALIAGGVLCIGTIFLMFSILYNVNAVSVFFKNYGGGSRGVRDVGNGVQDFFRLGGVTFLFVSISIVLKKLFLKVSLVNFILLVLFLFTVVLSSARSLLVGVFLILVFLTLKKMKPMTLLIVLCSSIFCFVFVAFFTDFSIAMFSRSDEGTSHKIKHALSFIDWTNNYNLLFGEGLASLYFSMASNVFTPQTEITLLDNIRYFGIVLTIVFYLALLFPSFSIAPWKVDNGFPLVVMLIYILMSLTNPMLVNSVGFIVVLWYWSEILNYKDKKAI